MNFAVESLHPAMGPTHGGNVVRVIGRGISSDARVWIDGIPAPVVLTDTTACYVQAPAHEAGFVDVEILSAGKRRKLMAAYRYTRPDLTRESDLTRLVRALLQGLKQHVAQACSMTVDVDYAGAATAESPAAAWTNLPALVLTGPELRENRTYTTNVGQELADEEGNWVGYAPAYTVDLSFNLVGASSSTVELLNLLNATVVFLRYAGSVSVLRDPVVPQMGAVFWPLVQMGDTRTYLDGPDGIKTFSCHFIVQGFDLASAQPQTVAGPAKATLLQTARAGGLR